MTDVGIVIIEQACLYLPLVIGAYISISLMKLPNLSLETAYVTGAVLSAKVISFYPTSSPLQGALASILVSILGGIFVGLLVGYMNLVGRLPFLLCTILVMGIMQGVTQWILGGAGISLSGVTTFFDYAPLFRNHPELFMLFVVGGAMIMITAYFLSTQLGYACAVYGDNGSFFKHYGISGNYVCMTGLLFSNACAGLSGALVAQKTGFADISMSSGMLLFCITALILGKVWSGLLPTLSAVIPVIGVGSYFMVQHLLIYSGFDLKYFALIQSLLVLSILLTYFRKKINRGNSIDHLGI